MMKPIEDIAPAMGIQKRQRLILAVPLGWWQVGAWLVVLACLSASYAAAQALVEYGHVTAAASAAASATQPVEKGITLPARQAGVGIPPVREGERAEVRNREALAAHAGKHSAKLMLRSVPNRARVRIDGKAVGRTPLLLIVAPGVYAVEMEGGARLDIGRQRVGLLPGETREVVLPLEPRYPARIRIAWPSHNSQEEGAPHGGI